MRESGGKMRLQQFNVTLLARIALGAALGLAPVLVAAAQDAPPPPPGPPPNAPLSPDQLQELVAPIALYPDSLVAQILAAATYPTQIVEAERFVQQNPGLTGQALANAVDGQDWAPCVKALTAFPNVLGDMNQNLSWTSELGDANYNQPQDVMNAIQFMRQRAQQAGNLQNTPQESVDDDNGDIQIEPANPDVVYVPEYDPEYAYGYPVGLWPGFDPWWTVGGPFISFGIGIGIGPWYGFGWGWRHWGLGWGPHPGVWFGGGRWLSQSHAFYDRRAFMHGNYRGFGGQGFVHGGGRAGFNGGVRGGFNGGARGGIGGERGRSGGQGGGFAGGNRTMRGYANRPSPGTRSGAFGGFGRGGDVRGFSSRGMSSMHGGFGGGSHGAGGFHGGGGGGHGGGGRR